MAQEAPEGSAFGVLALTEEEPLDEGLAGEGIAQEQATSTEQTQPPAGEPTGEQQPPEPGSVPEGGEQSSEQTQYAGKFGSVEALEKGYNEVQAWATRASQEAAEARRQSEAMQAQVAELRQFMDVLANPLLQQQLEANPELAEQLRQAQLMQQMTEQQVAPYRQQLEQMQQQQQATESEMQAALRVGQWRAQSGVQPNSPEDVALNDAVTALDLNWRDPETGHLALDLALEASRDPELLTVLKVNPHLIEIEGGIEYARQQAAFRKAQAPAVQQGTPQGQPTGTPGQAARQAAYVETGGQAAPTQGAPGGGKDEFDEAIAAYRAEKLSPLFQ